MKWQTGALIAGGLLGAGLIAIAAFSEDEQPAGGKAVVRDDKGRFSGTEERKPEAERKPESEHKPDPKPPASAGAEGGAEGGSKAGADAGTGGETKA